MEKNIRKLKYILEKLEDIFLIICFEIINYRWSQKHYGLVYIVPNFEWKINIRFVIIDKSLAYGILFGFFKLFTPGNKTFFFEFLKFLIFVLF